MQEKTNDQLDQAIGNYIESNDIEILKPFFGKVNGYEPYGQPELGQAINTGDVEAIKSIITQLTTFDESPKPKSRIDEELDYVKERKDSKKQEAIERDIINTKKQVAKANKNSTMAKDDLEKVKWEEKNLGKDKRKKENDKYLNDLGDQLEKLNDKYKTDDTTESSAETVNSSEVNKMKLSKNDMKRLTTALSTLSKHFAEEEAEDEVPANEEEAVDETPANEEDTPNEEEESAVFELPQSLVDEIQEALNNPIEEPELHNDEDEEEDDNDGEDEEEEYVPENEEDDDEDEEGYAACGKSSFSEDEFYEFSEAITETVQNLNDKIDEIAKEKTDLPSEEFIEDFSAKDFRSFAESITTTLENINHRIDQLESNIIPKNGDNKITTDLDVLKSTGDDYEEEFITKSDEDANVDGIVENPEISIINQASPEVQQQAAVGQQFSKRYTAVKNFLNFSSK